MLISLSKELKERDLNNPGLRRVVLGKLKHHRRTHAASNWETKRILRNFIWGFQWARDFPDMLEGNKLTHKQLQENEEEARAERYSSDTAATTLDEQRAKAKGLK